MLKQCPERMVGLQDVSVGLKTRTFGRATWDPRQWRNLLTTKIVIKSCKRLQRFLTPSGTKSFSILFYQNMHLLKWSSGNKFHFNTQVIEKNNFGEWVNKTDSETRHKAAQCFISTFISLVYEVYQPKLRVRVSRVAPSSLQVLVKVLQDASIGSTSFDRLTLQSIPNASIDEFWLPLPAFNVEASSKAGCRVFVKMFMGLLKHMDLFCVPALSSLPCQTIRKKLKSPRISGSS